MKLIVAVLAVALSATAVVLAHDVLYPGTVLAVEAERVQVKTVDPESRKEVSLWFTITKDTQVKRGDRVVSYLDARVQKDERIVVVVNHEEMGSEAAAKELRLAAAADSR